MVKKKKKKKVLARRIEVCIHKDIFIRSGGKRWLEHLMPPDPNMAGVSDMHELFQPYVVRKKNSRVKYIRNPVRRVSACIHAVFHGAGFLRFVGGVGLLWRGGCYENAFVLIYRFRNRFFDFQKNGIQDGWLC